MKIDLHNYEAFLLDFMEGTISEESRVNLNTFLQEHPELQSDLDDFAFISLNPEQSEIPWKYQLKKFNFEEVPVNSHNLEDFCIAFHENLLTESCKKKLMAYLDAHKEADSHFKLYSRVRVKPDFSITYPLKKGLYHTGHSIVLRRIFSVAATITLIMACYMTITFYKTNNTNKAAQTIAINSPQKKIAKPISLVLSSSKQTAPVTAHLQQTSSGTQPVANKVPYLALLKQTIHQEKDPVIHMEELKIFKSEISDLSEKIHRNAPQVIVVENIQNNSKNNKLQERASKSLFSKLFKKNALPHVSGNTLIAGTLKKIYEVSPVKINIQSNPSGTVSTYYIQAGKWKYVTYKQNNAPHEF